MKKTVPPLHFLPVANGGKSPLDEELRSRLTLAHADHTIRSMAGKLSFRLQELTRKAAYSHYIQKAVAAADPAAGMPAVIALLDAEFDRLSDELKSWNESASIAEQRARALAAEVNPLIVKSANLAATKRSQIEWLERKIFGAKHRKTDQIEKLRTAGLNDEQIDLLGLLPPPLDVEKLRRQIHILMEDIARLEAFNTDPLHRKSLLGDLDLDDDGWSRLQELEKVATEQVKAEVVVEQAKRAERVAGMVAIEAEKQAQARLLVDRAILKKAAIKSELNELNGKILANQARAATNPEMLAWRQRRDTLNRNLGALDDFISDTPLHRLEKLQGLSLDAA